VTDKSLQGCWKRGKKERQQLLNNIYAFSRRCKLNLLPRTHAGYLFTKAERLPGVTAAASGARLSHLVALIVAIILHTRSRREHKCECLIVRSSSSSAIWRKSMRSGTWHLRERRVLSDENARSHQRHTTCTTRSEWCSTRGENCNCRVTASVMQQAQSTRSNPAR
jgi:hypothetical protein